MAGSMLVHTDTTLISLQKAAENCITEWMRDDPDDKWDRTLAHYIKDFRLMELWPLSQIRECTVENVIRQFHQGQECTREGDGCYCHHMGYGFVGKLQRAADDICMQRGLCLSCVKQGRFLPEDGNCTAFIASECSSPEAKNSLPFFKHTN